MKTEEVERLYRTYFPCIYSICFLYMKNQADACDMVQDTFVKLMQGRFVFVTEEKAKAWLIVTAANCCKTHLGKWWRRNRVAYEEALLEMEWQDPDNLLVQMVEELDEKLRLPVYLFYFEGYTGEEIAQMLNLNASTVRSRLAKARKVLKLNLTEEAGDIHERRISQYG